MKYSCEKIVVRDRVLQLVNRVRAGKGLPSLDFIEPHADLRRDLGMDSLDLAELTVRIEEKFGVDVFEAGIVYRWGDIVSRLDR